MSDAADGRADLLGYWSEEHGFHSSMEDRALVFRPDGTGSYEFARPWYSDRTDFRWRLVGDGQMHVTAHLRVVSNEHPDPPTSQQHEVDVDETVRYAVTFGSRPLFDQPVRLLSLEASFATGTSFAFVGPEDPRAGA